MPNESINANLDTLDCVLLTGGTYMKMVGKGEKYMEL